MSKLQVNLDDQVFEIELQVLPDRKDEVIAYVNGEPVRVRILATQENPAFPEWTVIGDRSYEVFTQFDLKQLETRSEIHRVEVRDLDGVIAQKVSGDGRVKAPIPGVVTQVLVQAQQTIEIGQTLLVLEAMKMQNQIRAPREGIITALNVSPGHAVMLGELLAVIS